MAPQIAAFFGAGIAMGLTAIGTGLAIGMLSAKAMEGIARQPEAQNAIRISMIIAIAFIEAIALYALVISLILVSK